MDNIISRSGINFIRKNFLENQADKYYKTEGDSDIYLRFGDFEAIDFGKGISECFA
jgi:hypothetical protein